MAASREAPAPAFVPLVDVARQTAVLKGPIEARMAAVVARGDFVLGREVAELEQRLAEYAGAAAAVAVANGTDALQIALMAQGIGPGDAVLVPAFTFAATAGAVVLSGATPVFVDVEDVSLTLDPVGLQAAVRRLRRAGGPRPRAVIPVDLFGFPADYPAILAVAEAEGLSVVADAAQSFGARRGSRRVGALAPVTTTSFYPSKPLGCFGDGGAILTDDPDLAATCRALRGHGFDTMGEARQVGMNSRLDSLQAAVLLAKLEVFDDELATRRKAATWYTQRLAPVLRTPVCPPDTQSAWAVYTLRSPRRDNLRRALSAARIASAVYYAKPLHLQAAFAACGDGPGSLPVSERAAQEVLALPMHGYLDAATVSRICDVVLAALEPAQPAST
jgi:dTDP-4-amino-4,6-dideoxygalactose transaminase